MRVPTGGDTYTLNVGRVAVEKNLEAFLELDLPGTKVVVGDGPQRAALQRQIWAIANDVRGAVDGLNVIVPYQEANYYQSRPKIAIPKPGQQGGAIDLDGRFGLHPALGAIAPLWQQKTLAFVHACGSPDPSRSHFDAQDYMESGTPGKKNTPDGWMNRLLSFLPPLMMSMH